MYRPRRREVEVVLGDKVAMMPRPAGWRPHRKGEGQGPPVGAEIRTTVSLSDVSFQAGRYTVVLGDRVAMMPRPSSKTGRKG